MKHARNFTISICFLLFFFSFIPNIFAEKGQIYEVGIASLNIRTAPSHSSDVVGMLNQGDHIVSFQEKHGWVMTYYGGKKVWVASHFLSPVTDEENPSASTGEQTKADVQSKESTITVDADDTRIRSGAGRDYPTLKIAKTGDTYQLIEMGEDWHKISLADGSTGWIASWLTDSPTTAEEDTKEGTEENTPQEKITIKETNEVDNKGATNSSLDGKTIVLDPGHGGKDPGSLGLDGVKEKDVIMTVTDDIANQLRSAGADVVLTRTGDYFISLDERVKASHTNDADAFVSLHYNAFPMITAQGMNTYYYSDDTDQKLAESIHSSLEENIEMADRGVGQGNFQVLRENNNPSVLLELGFITNPEDLLQIQSTAYKDGVANGITDGLRDYLN